MALLIVLVAVSAALLAPGLVIGPSLDPAVFNLVGDRWLEGITPYVGTWDHKTPGIYLASAAAQALFGWLGSWTADWLLSVAATVGIGVALARVLARLGITGLPRALATVGATILAAHYLLSLGGGLTEPPGTFLVACALAGVLVPGRPSGARLTGIGALLAGSLLFSVQLLPGAVAVFALGLAMAPRSSRVLHAVAILAGGAVVGAAVIAGLASTGVLPAALDAMVGYSAAYRASSGEYGGPLAAPVAAWTLLVSLFLVAPALLGAAALPRLSGPRRAVAMPCLAWIVVSLALFVAQGRFYAHYAIPLAVPLGVLAALGLERTAASLRRGTTRTARLLVTLPLVATLLGSVVAGVVATSMQIAPVADGATRMRAVALRIAGELPGSLLVWGNDPWLFELSGREPATRYLYLYPLTTPGYSTDAMITEVLGTFRDSAPALIVDAGSTAPGAPGFLPLLIDRPVLTDGRDLDLLDPIRAFVAENYQLVDIVAGWPIYVWRGPLAETAP